MPQIPLLSGAISTNPATTLAEVLARPDIWRGDALASAPKPGVPTGFAALDAELPGGGWPRGAVVELIMRHDGIGGMGEMSLLMPALTAQFSSVHRGWTVCIAPPLLPFAPGWRNVTLQRLMVVRARGDDAAWACARALDTEGVAAVLAWLPGSRAATIRRLQLLAERSEALVFVFRPCACATQSSPAPLRLMLDGVVRNSVSPAPTGKIALVQPPLPQSLSREGREKLFAPSPKSRMMRTERIPGIGFAPSPIANVACDLPLAGEGRGEGEASALPSSDQITTLAVHLIKRRGAGRTAPIYLNLPRPRRQSYAMPNLLPAEREAMPPSQANSHVVVESAISAISA